MLRVGMLVGVGYSASSATPNPNALLTLAALLPPLFGREPKANTVPWAYTEVESSENHWLGSEDPDVENRAKS